MRQTCAAAVDDPSRVSRACEFAGCTPRHRSSVWTIEAHLLADGILASARGRSELRQMRAFNRNAANLHREAPNSAFNIYCTGGMELPEYS